MKKMKALTCIVLILSMCLCLHLRVSQVSAALPTGNLTVAWWGVGDTRPYSTPSQIIADVVTLKTLGFNTVNVNDFDLYYDKYDADPSQYHAALIAQECQKNGMYFILNVWIAAVSRNPRETVPMVDPDSPAFRNSFGPHLQRLANYFKQFSCLIGIDIDDWIACGVYDKVDNYDEWTNWVRSQFNIGRDYWIQYSGSFGNDGGWPYPGITQPYTIINCGLYSRTGAADPSWIDTFANWSPPWANFPNLYLGLVYMMYMTSVPSDWLPDKVRPQVERALQYPRFKWFEYFPWRFSDPESPPEWSTTLAKHPEWWTAIAAINAEILGAQPPSTGTLRVFASYQGSYVATLVTITGPESKSGTTTDSGSPLTFELTPGAYMVSGNYAGTPQNTTVTVVVGEVRDAPLDFGGTPPPPDLWAQIVELVNQILRQVAGDTRILFLGGILVFGLVLWYGSRRLSKRA